MWIDSQTKYAGVHIVNYTDSKTTIVTLKTMFAHFRLPYKIVSDNDTPSVGEEFFTFFKTMKFVTCDQRLIILKETTKRNYLLEC